MLRLPGREIDYKEGLNYSGLCKLLVISNNINVIMETKFVKVTHGSSFTNTSTFVWSKVKFKLFQWMKNTEN